MFWGWKKSEDDKEKQLRQLKNAFPSIRRPQNDDSLFEIRFMVDNQSNALRIFIPGDFPAMRPVLQVAGPVEHPWLDQFKQVNGNQRLMNWNKSSILVEIVEETLSTLMNSGVASTAFAATDRNSISAYGISTSTGRNSLGGLSQDSRASLSYGGGVGAGNVVHGGGQPYGVAMNSGGSPYGAQSSGSASVSPAPFDPNARARLSTGSAAVVGPAMVNAESPGAASPSMADPSKLPAKPSAESSALSPLAMPEIPQVFPELEKMSDIQLERLIKDDVALLAHVEKNVGSIEMMRSMIEDLQLSNAKEASANVLMHDEVQSLRDRAISLQKRLQEATKEYQKEHAALMDKVSFKPENILQELNKDRQRLDDQSEELGRKVVSGDMEVALFLKDYLEVRTKYHVLSAKVQLARIV